VIKLEIIQRKQDDLRTIASKTAEGVQTLENLTNEGAKKIRERSDNAVNVIESSTSKGLDRIKQETDTLMDSIDAKTKNAIEKSVETLRIQSDNERESITKLGKKGKTDLVELVETLQKTLYTRSIDDREEQYITSRKSKLSFNV
jgi:formate dehydrogenase maturation protein FdhE